MAKPTIAKLTHLTHSYGTTFKTTAGYDFEVIRFSNNILDLQPSILCDIYQTAEIVAGCFETRSTFAGVEQVNFIFNDKKVYVRKEENATPEMIVKKWQETPYQH